MIRKASAVWQGDLKGGKGTVSTDSGVLSNTQYSFNTRFDNGKGTNPEELIAAAHAGCFSMALSAELGKAGITPERIETVANLNFDKQGRRLGCNGHSFGHPRKTRQWRPQQIRCSRQCRQTGCPISRLLNTKITLDAKLV